MSIDTSNHPKLQLTQKPSLITTETVALSGVSFCDLQVNRNEGFAVDSLSSPIPPSPRLYFRCTDPNRAGKSLIQSVDAEQGLDGSKARTHTPVSHNVRSAVHEYGGGAFVVVPGDGGLVYTDFPSHCVYHVVTNNNAAVPTPTRIYPPSLGEGTSSSRRRFADFVCIPLSNNDDGDPGASCSPSFTLLAIMEDHDTVKDTPIVTNSLVRLDQDGTISTLASGHDFYAAPAYNPITRQLAFVAWDHPYMPWDQTGLYILQLDETYSCSTTATGTLSPTLIHGGPLADLAADSSGKDDSDVSVYAPQWHRNQLYFLSNATGWYNLYRYDNTGSGDDTPTLLYPLQADLSEAKSGWVLHTPCFTFCGDWLCAVYSTKQGGKSIILAMDTNDHQRRIEYVGGGDVIVPSSVDSLCGSGKFLFFCGGGTKQPKSIWCCRNLTMTGKDEAPGPAVELLPSLSMDNLEELQQFMSEPVLIEAKSNSSRLPGGTGRCFAYYYPPNNLHFDLDVASSSETATEVFRPPMLVKAHGGPTARTSTTFRLDIQFWTSRGFAVLDVDYGGSTGYGKEYQQSLLGNWGLVDVDDVEAAAIDRIEQGLVNSDWVCIDGSSAGGYTTLAALTFTDTFQAGASMYGIGDLSMLAQETHKFESRYLDRLIGPYPEAKVLYDERTPTLHIDKLCCPCILLQGDEDKVVPPSQAEAMFQALKLKGVPTSLVMYKGEQHGFRKSDNIGHALLSEYNFFCEVFGFVPMQDKGFGGVKIGERIEI